MPDARHMTAECHPSPTKRLFSPDLHLGDGAITEVRTLVMAPSPGLGDRRWALGHGGPGQEPGPGELKLGGASWGG